MKLLVTGHLGYIGTVMTPLLLEAGHQVTGLDLDLYSRCTYPPSDLPDLVPTIRKDIRDVELSDLIGVDAILHLAGLSNDPLGDLNPLLTDQINHLAAVRLAALAKEAGVQRFLFSSSCSCYGAAGDEWIDEESPLLPATPYGLSKVNAEKGILALADEHFSPILLRSATAYGLSPRLRFDLVLNNLVAWAVTTGRIHLKSDGTPWRPIVHIEDIARAFIALLEAPRHLTDAEVFNVGRTEHNYRIRELAEIVAAVVPGCELEISPTAAPDKRCYRVNCDKLAQRLPHFEPQWNPARAARSLVDAYRSGGLQLSEFEGTRYQRVGHIRMLMEKGVVDEELRCSSCHSCGKSKFEKILDLGRMPLSDGLLSQKELSSPEPRYPLELVFCTHCKLVQITEVVPPTTLFGDDYPYFSSFSRSWLQHNRDHALDLIEDYSLSESSFVVELASNDGYLLRNFVERGIPALGIDPAKRPVEAAREAGVETRHAFFTRDLARELRAEGKQADLIIANNVLAHVADCNGFVEGVAHLLQNSGTFVVEVPYVRDLVDENEFDTIYHQHLCYFSLTSVKGLFERNGLYINDVKRILSHGGSLRLYASKKSGASDAVLNLLAEEEKAGLNQMEYYRGFADRVSRIRDELRTLVARCKEQGKRIAAYGAAAKGTILLNYVGLNTRDIDYVVDLNVHKQGRYIPGARLPIFAPDKLLSDQPDYLLILPWNLREEIIEQEAEYSARNGQFIVPIPTPRILQEQPS